MTTELAAPGQIALKPKPASGAGKPVKVLMVCNSLRWGGGAAMSVDLANALATEGLDVFFASGGGALRTGLDQRVHYLPTDIPGHGPSRVTHELLLYIKHHRFDVIHTHGAAGALLVSIAARASHVRPVRVVTYHARILRRAPRWVAKAVMSRCADHFVAYSREKQAELETLGIRAERISLIPAFVDVDAIATRIAMIERASVLRSLGVPEGARVLMMAGRVTSGRRFDRFVRIAAEVARCLPEREIHALVVGDGPALGDVRRVAVREGAPAKIHFLGHPGDLLPWLAATDVVVYPSTRAGSLPRFLLEAGAAARPIVCSDLSAHREVVADGQTGRLVAGDVAEFAAATEALLRHPETGALYAHAAQQRVQQTFDRPTVVRAMVGVYTNLLQKH